MSPIRPVQNIFGLLRWMACLPLLLTAPSLLAGDAAAQSPPLPATLRVVSDDNYPPYVFRDSQGQLQGIIPDQWALWEKKTGIKVELTGMDWAAAQPAIIEGRAEVIDSIFRTPEREKIFLFTKPYATIPVPVYAHRDLGGLINIESLQGFAIGVKAGDAVIEFLTNRGIRTLVEYPSYESIIQAAGSNLLKVFSVDQPAAVYYLHKYRLADQIYEAFVLYTGRFHRAVLRQQPEILALVESGFDQISRGEYRAIEKKWLGRSFLFWQFLHEWLPLIIAALGVIVLLAAGNLVLRKQVRARTMELQQTMEELHRSQIYLRRLLKIAPVGLGVVKNRCLVEANDAFCQISGYPAEELLGHSTRKLYASEEEYERVGKIFYEEIAREGQAALEFRGRRKDGTLCDHWLKGTLLNPEHPEDGVLFAVVDLTERKAAEEARLRYEQRLQEAQRLESIGLLAGGIAHDFNNLLGALSGNLELAAMVIPPDSPAQADLENARRVTRRAADLVQQIWAYSGRGNYPFQAVDITAIIHETLDLLQSSLAGKARVDLQLPPQLPAIAADALQIQQVIMNILLNALESLPSPEGIIRVAACIGDGALVPSMASWPAGMKLEGPCLVLEISDSGSGIPPDILPKIFDPFFSTKFTGRGLGLSAALGIIRRHRGVIHVESAPGKGSSFQIYLPIAAT